MRTVHVPGSPERPGSGGPFLKFSLEVQITHDIRRMRGHELCQGRRTDPLVAAAFAAMGGPAVWLSEPGYRTARDFDETFPVLVREGLDEHLVPGAKAVPAAALAEGFDGNPLDRLADPPPWWEANLGRLVPPVPEAFARRFPRAAGAPRPDRAWGSEDSGVGTLPAGAARECLETDPMTTVGLRW
ncbi:IucA/IucC family protein [Streptomyces sp. NPDC012756]|uniref:IucA/IucC family protein n=1 Tax=Streptomyces sp. NPDC012756 TaxID=3364847 RepID=UPI00368652F1